MGITPLDLEDPIALQLDLPESTKRERAETAVRASMEASQALNATGTFQAFDDGVNPMFMMMHAVGGALFGIWILVFAAPAPRCGARRLIHVHSPTRQ